MTREKKKAEAVKRMKAMGLYDLMIQDFEQEDHVQISEPPMGACYWLNEEQQERLKKVEDKYNCVVYHVILSLTDFGTIENYLFVSDYEEEWEDEWEEMKDGILFAHCENLDYPDCSECGDIGVAVTIAGGLQRTA